MYTQENGYFIFPPDDREQPGQLAIQKPLDTYGGSGNSDDNNYDSDNIIFLPVPQDSIINSHTLSVIQLMNLDLALKELIEEGCMQEALYNALLCNNVKLDFGMYSNPSEKSASANYDPRDRSIKFKNNSSITKDNLKEELFHAWQDSYYPDGIWQYRETGKVNIEFEAKVYSDLFGNPDAGCCYAFRPGFDNLPDDLYNDYIRWAYNIRENKTTLQDSDYQKWLNLFNQYNTEYFSPMHDNLSTPNAIRNLINQSDCY